MANWMWDEILLACDLVAANNWRELRPKDPRVVELSDFLRAQVTGDVLDDNPTFRNPDGVSRKTTDIMTAHPQYDGAKTKGGHTTTEMVLAYLANPDLHHRAATTVRASGDLGRTVGDALGGPVEDEPAAIEGRVIHRLIRTRERDPKLRASKIKQALSRSGSLACEVCAFDFARTYGDLGDGYVHVHHVVPLHASGEVSNVLDDLVLVCANCHVMLHRGATWRMPEQLRELVRTAGGRA
jgi:5-methylcytosine-specific restriction protein A